MAIQVRRGNEADFDASKMLPGELAVSLDARYVRMCFAPGIVLRMATYDSFEADMSQIKSILAECKSIQSAVQRIQSEVNSKASLTIEYANSAKQSADRAYSEAERAKTYANNAEAVTGVQIATKDRAGLIKGGDNHIAEDGTLMLITETTETTMPNSYDGRLLVDEIGGVCKQVSTSGANLINQACVPADATQKHFLKAGAYTVSRDASEDGGAWYIGAYESDGTAITKGTLSIDGYSLNSTEEFLYGGGSSNFSTFAITKDCYVKAGVLNGSGKTYLMLNAGTTALPYEPYTGGLPSPSPSYPQEIKKSVVSGVKTHGKQHINPNNTFNGSPIIEDAGYTISHTGKNAWAQRGFIVRKVESGQTWYASAESLVNTVANKGTIAFQQRDADKKILSTSYLREGQLSVNFTILENTADFTILIIANTSSTDLESNNTITIKGLMLSHIEGSKWEPYTESSITLSNPIDLYGIGDVQDVIENGKVKRKFAKVVFDGSSDESWSLRDTATGGLRYAYNLPNAKTSDTTNGVRSINSNFIITKAGGTYNKNNCYTIGNDSVLYCVLNMTETLSEWKSYLQANPMTVVYELATEITEALPIADQVALNSLATYDGITYLEFDSEVQPTFEGEYGTSKVGGYTLDGMLAGRNGELMGKNYADRITALESTVVNNI